MLEGGDEVAVALCLSILSALLSGKIKISQSECVLLQDLLPYLHELKEHTERHISQLSSELFSRIITKDSTWFDHEQGPSGMYILHFLSFFCSFR